jgi:putative PIN family toxin of toxin-antitoxin system
MLDTNILVSSLMRKETPPYLLYRAWRSRRFVLLTSSWQLAEVEDVFSRPRLQKYILEEEAREIVRGLRTEAEQIDMSAVDVSYSPDPDDNRVLAIAIVGRGDYVVSGDKAHMLSLGEVEGIPIITARQASDIFS